MTNVRLGKIGTNQAREGGVSVRQRAKVVPRDTGTLATQSAPNNHLVKAVRAQFPAERQAVKSSLLLSTPPGQA